MYSASNAFHEAVANGNDQMPLLIFKDAVFTQSDIDVDDGIQFDDNFSLEEDISIGQTPANEIRFTLFNDYGYLNNYTFGEFIATLGVKISEAEQEQTASVMMHVGNDVYTGSDTSPYLRKNGTAMGSQPAFAVKSLMCYDGKVWAFGADGSSATYNADTGADISATNKLNNFMKNKVKGWSGLGLYYNKSNRELTIEADGAIETYEFVPLGVFVADRPNVPDTLAIQMTCRDHMLDFEKDWPGFSAMGVTFPTTVGTLFQKICAYLNVPYKTATFLNSTLSIPKEPKDKFENVTMRTVLSWIAEVAGSNARFDRDGNLVMAWINSDNVQSYAEGDYYEFKPYWYETKKIDKLYNRKTKNGKDTIVGTGTGGTGYLIQDNPFLND